MMLKNFFENTVKEAIKKASKENKLQGLEEIELNLMCETPKNTEFGDYAINVSSLSRYTKTAPPVTADIIKDFIEQDGFEINVIAGFINFKLNEKFIIKILNEVLDKKENFGKIDLGKGKKVNIEYVSANPTGPFHIGHGRWAAIGSALAEILKYTGYDVTQEFYINDAGNQIQKLAKSLELRVKELKGEKVEWDDDLYKGDYLIPCAEKYIKNNEGLSYGDFAKKDMLNLQKELLKKFRTDFDIFFSEKTLYENKEVEKSVNQLKEAGKLYEKDGAVWFKSTDYTDSQDRVLKKSDGTNTYLTADIAYHKNKLDRNFELLIDIWGADHHGYIPRMKAAIDALGYDSKKLEVLLGQLVNIIENGEAVRMGKRKKMVTLGELVDEVGVDATRYWMLMRSIDTTLDFDVELAKTKTDQNPVFYVQYAHARACSVLRKAVEERVNIETKEKMPAMFTEEELDKILECRLKDKLYDNDEKSTQSIRQLILKLEEFKSVTEAASRLRAPYILCKYASELASDFHRFYNFTRVLTEDLEATKARILIVYAVKIIMASTLKLLRVEAPERM